ncbi:MAG: hypothetical protein EA401_00385, partial [Planctomycetota bacterium]
PAVADRLTVAHIQGRERPVQIQRLQRDGEDVARAWFIATIDDTDEGDVPVRYSGGSIEPGISMEESGDFYVIDNGVYQFRLRRSQDFAEPIPFDQVPHWFGGARTHGHDAWDGRAWFEGTAPVSGVSVEIVEQGPVFIDAAITYHFVAEEDGTTQALPLDMGKQVYHWEPNTPPRETVPKLDHSYELRLRFMMGHPLVEANERFHLPQDPDAGDFGVHQHWMAWGDPEGAPDLPWFDENDGIVVDTITWVRWFLYDRFGGNVDQNWVAAEPRDDQRGRPFALLRPRWNQGGGGAQDFVMTSGGSRPFNIEHFAGDRRHRSSLRRRGEYRNADEALRQEVDALLEQALDEDLPTRERFAAAKQAEELLGRDSLRMPAENYDASNPAVAVLATFASKWVGPYPATIATYAHDRNRGSARFPLRDGERSGMHYGQRSFTLGIGERQHFNDLNAVVRRFTDWTLQAVTNKYITQWERDPSLAGPNVYVTRERIEELRAAYETGEGQIYEIIRDDMQRLRELQAQRDELEPRVQAARAASRNSDASEEDREAAKEKHDELRSELREIEEELDSTDMQILRLITEGFQRNVGLQDATLWLSRRYQDDFLNPTSRAVRNVKNFAEADLFSGGEPIGGGRHAALGYISTDLDAWPGWHQGWSPGNPNFHTDKYMGAIYIGGALRDHPHSDEWLQFGWENFLEDVDKVLFAPDGVGYECPGYAGYAMRLQLGLARIFLNAGFGNPVAENPLFKKSGIWHRKLITPKNHRIGMRHAAPIGDTHRWNSGLNHGFGALAAFHAESDPKFASEMQGTWHMLLEEGGLRIRNRLRTELLDTDPSIEPMDPMDMDWSSDVFHGFGAIMRNHFGSERESFMAMKAGPTRGHYHNDELAYHFYSSGQPISLHYHTSYTPRADHAALHNSMTFGNEGHVRHNDRNENVAAMEQLFSTAWPGAFVTTDGIDVVVAERRGNSVTMSPVDPYDYEFQRRYPSRNVDAIVHRRYLAMVKHDKDSAMHDYLVIRDETVSSIPQAVNIHLLASESTVDGNLITARGQHDMDMAVFVAEATDLQIDNSRSYWYGDSWMKHPGEEYTIRVGESITEWEGRMQQLMAEHGVDSLPLPGWSPRWGQDHPDHAAWHELREATDGKAMIPPPGWSETWLYGEYQHWLRLNTAPGTPVLWVLYPYKKGEEQPSFESLADGTGVRVSLGDEVQEIYLATDPAEGVAGQAVIRR